MYILIFAFFIPACPRYEYDLDMYSKVMAKLKPIVAGCTIIGLIPSSCPAYSSLASSENEDAENGLGNSSAGDNSFTIITCEKIEKDVEDEYDIDAAEVTETQVPCIKKVVILEKRRRNLTFCNKHCLTLTEPRLI